MFPALDATATAALALVAAAEGYALIAAALAASGGTALHSAAEAAALDPTASVAPATRDATTCTPSSLAVGTSALAASTEQSHGHAGHSASPTAAAISASAQPATALTTAASSATALAAAPLAAATGATALGALGATTERPTQWHAESSAPLTAAAISASTQPATALTTPAATLAAAALAAAATLAATLALVAAARCRRAFIVRVDDGVLGLFDHLDPSLRRDEHGGLQHDVHGATRGLLRRGDCEPGARVPQPRRRHHRAPLDDRRLHARRAVELPLPCGGLVQAAPAARSGH